MERERRLDLGLTISASLIGSLVFAIATGIAIARSSSVPGEHRAALGLFLVIPLWVTAMCFGFLARSGARAWLGFLVLSAIACALSYLAAP